MWSNWLVFCDCLSALWWRRIRDLWKLPDGRDWLRGKLGLILMDRVMLSKYLIQFYVDGKGCFPSLLFDLRPNYGGGHEDNGDLQNVPCRHCYPQCPRSCSRPPSTHASTRKVLDTLIYHFSETDLGNCWIYPLVFQFILQNLFTYF